MTTFEKRRDEAAEKHAFTKGVAHTLRDNPAWHYSLIDFNAGSDWARAETLKEIKQLICDLEYFIAIYRTDLEGSGVGSAVLKSLAKWHERTGK